MEIAYASALTVIWTLASLWWLRQRPSLAGASEQHDIVLVYASQSGTARRLAERYLQQFNDARELNTTAQSPAARLYALDEISPQTLAGCKVALFVVSTFGDGVAPDHATAFVRDHLGRNPLNASATGNRWPELSQLRYAVLALGDRHYANFCAFGHCLDQALQHAGAARLWPVIEVDRQASSALQQWQQQLQHQFQLVESQTTTALSCRLLHREQLNPQSPNPSLYLVRMSALGPSPLRFEPGDIAQVQLPNGEQRSYSVANYDSQGSGQLELIIRQVTRTDGTPGVGSHWLTERVDGGSEILIRIQSGLALTRLSVHTPVIMIGAGSGLAGVRALLQYRQQAGVQGDWLITGERDARFDLPLWQQWQDACDDGTLGHWDACFSRSPEQPFCYVQDALMAHPQRLRDLLMRGACIYVCGSAAGLGESVDACLHSLLGPAVVTILQTQQRYLRDIY
ncbi:hypothetical protein CWE12_09960 [Aliidiomarina sedimenti]|uniref:NADPH--hemoprotein reductase n=1 Tax=Aliidiomarina sedimenti TaxID=1933879 RepID=A0ABY0BXT9_9GAMM|nr:NADPH cytochrome P450 oxidoreductase family protein [Aliidiomarina sedimenti]RUO29299.1 hypothetical protein CWE12_09960 [Aliidiomarina sedimenti]